MWHYRIGNHVVIQPDRIQKLKSQSNILHSCLSIKQIRGRADLGIRGIEILPRH